MNPSGLFLLLLLFNFALFEGHAQLFQCKGRHSPKSLGCVAEWNQISDFITNAATSPSRKTQTFALGVLATIPFMDSQGLSPQQYNLAFQSNPSDISLVWTVVESMEHTDACLTRTARAKYAQLGRRGKNIASAFRGWKQFTHTFAVPPKVTYMLQQAVIKCRQGTVEFRTGNVRLKILGRH